MQDLVAVWLGAMDGTTWWERDADEPVYAASLVKVPLATAAEGLDLDAGVVVHADFDSVVPGERYRLRRRDDQDDATWDAIGSTLTLRELRRRALVDSGNLASALLLEAVGVDTVRQVVDVGGGSTFRRGIGDEPARAAGLTNLVTARDMGRLIGTVPRAVETELLGQRHRGGIPAGLPDDTRVANKTGWVDGIAHDAAIVRPQEAPPFLLVVLTRTGAPREVAERRIAEVAAEAWRRAGGSVR